MPHRAIPSRPGSHPATASDRLTRPLLESGAPVPPLEVDIEEIQGLSRLRQSAVDLLRGRLGEMDARLSPSKSAIQDGNGGTRFLDFAEAALVALAVNRSPHGDEVDRQAAAAMSYLLKLSIADVLLPEEADILGLGAAPGPRPIPVNVPVLQAARSLQALVDRPSTAITRASMVALYRIMLELYSATPPDYTTGSAASRLGWAPNAFVTGECVRAITALMRAVRVTGEILVEIHYLHTSSERLFRSRRIPARWKVVEYERLFRQVHNDLLGLYPRSCLDLAKPLDGLGTAIVGACSGSAGAMHTHGRMFVFSCIEIARAAAANGAREIERAALEVTPTQGPTRSHPVLLRQMLLASHQLAMEVLGTFRAAANVAADLLSASDADIIGQDTLQKLGTMMVEKGRTIRALTTPAVQFIESCIDREEARASTGERVFWDVPELAFATASYVALKNWGVHSVSDSAALSEHKGTRDVDRPRIHRAVSLLTEHLFPDGTFPTGLPLDSDEHGYRLLVWGSEVHRAFAQVLEKSEVLVCHELADRMLRYYRNSAGKDWSNPEWGGLADVSPADQRTGREADDPFAPKTHTWELALEVLGLDRYIRMLDTQINRRVYRHFSVRRPADIKPYKELPKLFYPDYGLAARREDGQQHLTASMSVAHALERLRAHLHGLSCVPSEPPLFSLVLFGPGGTGKTSLIEALVRSAERHLVEITPSDLVSAGTEAFEGRARVVFGALSCLTDTVVLFDEFDQVLLDRSVDEGHPRDIFSFVTPAMLPKLGYLYDRAEEQRVVYVLLTNRAGTLDEAAVRGGRFAEKLGVYTPDLLSRAGRLAFLVEQHPAFVGKSTEGPDGPKEVAARWDRAADVVIRSGGLGLSSLCRKPNCFGEPQWKKWGTGQNSALYFVLEGQPKWTTDEPDSDLGRRVAGTGGLAKREQFERIMVMQWDKSCSGSSWDSVMETCGDGPGGR